MSRTFDRILAKITRAKQHIYDLQLGIKAFFETHPYTVAIKDDAQAGQRVYYVSKANSVPVGVETIAADVIQNLRSPLDQIVSQLAIAKNRGPISDKLHYPIRDKASDYPSARGAVAKHVSEDVICAIDATEPYQGGKGHALWQLNSLNNPDKHIILVGTCSKLAGIDISGISKQAMASAPAEGAEGERMKAFVLEHLDAIVPALWIRPAAHESRLYVGAELWREPLHIEVKHERRFAFDISIDAPGIVEPESVLKTLYDMTNLVEGIVLALGKFLPD